MRRFQNTEPYAVAIPDGSLLPGEVVEFERVPRDVSDLTDSGILIEIAEEAPQGKDKSK